MTRAPILFATFALLVVACGGVASPGVPGECGGSSSCALNPPLDGGAKDSGVSDAPADAPIGLIDGGGTFFSCTGPGTCILTSKSCCGTCSTPKLTDFVAVRRTEVNAYQSSKCSGDFGCPGCAPPPEDPLTNGSLQAVCRAGTCEGFDVRESDLSKCKDDSDCTARGSSCCECGSTTFVALNKNSLQAYAAEMCEPNTACATCAPAPPGRPACNLKTKHCELRGPDAG